ncbi:MAG: hypothetical protein AAGJ28_09410 [Pseudomonadota bacterium]
MKQALILFLAAIFFVTPFVAAAVFVAGSAGGAVMIALLALLVMVLAVKSDVALHRIYGARQVRSSTAPELVMLAYTFADRAGLPRPRIALFDSAQPNGFTTRSGRSERWTIVLSRALLSELTREEAEAVIALATARRRAGALVQAQIAATIGSTATIILNGSLIRRQSDNLRPVEAYGQALASMTAPLASVIVGSAHERLQIYRSDREAASLLGNPLALARTLSRLDGLASEAENYAAERHPATAYLFVVNPLHTERLKEQFRVQASIEDRVARLKRLSGVGLP